MDSKLCSMEGCSRPHAARGLCFTHYRRWYRRGDPNLAEEHAPAGSGAINNDGYRVLSIGGVRYLEHRLVMARELGRPLRSDEAVHHIDGDKLNNAPSNLELMSTLDHVRHHGAERRSKARCHRGHLFTPENTYVAKKTGRRNCRQCSRERAQGYRPRA